MSSQPTLLSTCRRSALPIAYHMHASQWAISANVAISSSSTAAPYSEYRSIFRATRTSLSSRAVFSSPISVVVCAAKCRRLANVVPSRPPLPRAVLPIPAAPYSARLVRARTFPPTTWPGPRYGNAGDKRQGRRIPTSPGPGGSARTCPN